MSKQSALVGIVWKRPLTSLFLSAAVIGVLFGILNTQNLQARLTAPVLSSCGAARGLFPVQAQGNVEQWIRTYNGNVDEIITDVMKDIENPVCVTNTDADIPESLRTLSYQLEPWAQGQRVQLKDAPAVLLEYARVYECTLREWNAFALLQGERDNNGFNLFQQNQLALSDQKRITQELSVARPALERTLEYIGGSMRLAPLTQNMNCLVRTSADIRNVLGLAAETSMCMPRAWDTKNMLKTLAPSDE